MFIVFLSPSSFPSRSLPSSSFSYSSSSFFPFLFFFSSSLSLCPFFLAPSQLWPTFTIMPSLA